MKHGKPQILSQINIKQHIQKETAQSQYPMPEKVRFNLQPVFSHSLGRFLPFAKQCYGYRCWMGKRGNACLKVCWKLFLRIWLIAHEIGDAVERLQQLCAQFLVLDDVIERMLHAQDPLIARGFVDLE